MPFVDPAVSRAKFERELATYRQMEEEYLRRGWWLLKAEFPKVFIVFAASKLKPPAVVMGALLDFSDYDLLPPSVKLVDPFTREPYAAGALPTLLPRRAPVGKGGGATTPGAEVQVQSLMQAHEGSKPFLCLPGVREYHDHPGHSGDEWLLHRQRGEGTLFFTLEKLYRYGVEHVVQTNFNVQINFAGFVLSDVPD